MVLYEYQVLNPDEKAQIIWDKDIFIVNKKESVFSINLYALFDFHV